MDEPVGLARQSHSNSLLSVESTRKLYFEIQGIAVPHSLNEFVSRRMRNSMLVACSLRALAGFGCVTFGSFVFVRRSDPDEEWHHLLYTTPNEPIALS
jgi:hypothetical protein